MRAWSRWREWKRPIKLFYLSFRFLLLAGPLEYEACCCAALHDAYTPSKHSQRKCSKEKITERQRQNHLSDKHSAAENFRQILMLRSLTHTLVRSLACLLALYYGWPAKYWPIFTITNAMCMSIWEIVPSNRNEWTVSQRENGNRVDWPIGVQCLLCLLLLFICLRLVYLLTSFQFFKVFVIIVVVVVNIVPSYFSLIISFMCVHLCVCVSVCVISITSRKGH